MAYYTQRLCTTPLTSILIPTHENVPFETVGTTSDMRNLGDDFTYDDASKIIEFHRLGRYIIIWSVTQQSGVPGDGQTFQLYKEDVQQLDLSVNPPKPGIILLSGASTQLKTTTSMGIAVVDKNATHDILRLGVKNISKDTVTLTSDVDVKAQIMIYGAGDADGELTMLHKRINLLEDAIGSDDGIAIYDKLMTVATTLQTEIESGQVAQSTLASQILSEINNIYLDLTTMTTPSEIFSNSVDVGIPGLIMHAQYVENHFNFWISGAFTGGDLSTYATTSNVYLFDEETGAWETTPVGVEERIYLWHSNPSGVNKPTIALSWYQGDFSISPAWKNKVAPNQSLSMIPIYQENSGIYVLLDDVNDMMMNDFLEFNLGLFLFEP